MGLVLPEYGLLFWMLLTFLIVLFILKKFAWKPILNSLKEREDSIEDSLKLAEKAREEMANLQASNERILAEARKEREDMLKDARDIKQKMIDDAKDKASIEANKIIEQAKLVIENEKATAIDQIKRSIADMSIQIAEKILKKELSSSAEQQEIMDKYLNNLKLN
jgi:F-type H+-transporting ATPase subunit b